MGIVDVIEDLVSAAERADVTVPIPAGDDAAITVLEDVIAPLILPPALRQWWGRVDVSARAIEAFPQFTTPSEAAELWRDKRAPRVLLDIAHEGWNFMAIELAGEHGEGGRLFEYHLGDGSFFLRWLRLDYWLAHIAERVGSGQFDRTSTGLRARIEDQYSVVTPYRPMPGQPVERPEPISVNDWCQWPPHWTRVEATMA